MAASLSKQEYNQYSSSYHQSHQNRNSNVLLGYPDEIIAQQHLKDVDFTTSKIGGQAVMKTVISSNDSCLNYYIFNCYKFLNFHCRIG